MQYTARMINRIAMLAVLVGSVPYAVAAPKQPSIAEVKTFAINDGGALVPYNQNLAGHDIVLAIRVDGEPGTSVPVTFTATENLGAQYAEARQKAPPKKKVKFARKVTLEGSSSWVLLQIELSCYDDAKLEVGKAKRDLAFEGSCVL